MESLQNDIETAICLVSSGYRVKSSELNVLFKMLGAVEDSELKLSKKSKRASVINMLMDFLYECNDMEYIPEPFLNAVSYINKNSLNSDCRSVLKQTVEEEVELMLGFTAQIKQVVWDQVPELEVEKDFADASVETFKEDDDDQGLRFYPTRELTPDDLNCSSESFGEIIPHISGLLRSAGTVDGSPLVLSADSLLRRKLQSVYITERGVFKTIDLSLSSWPESEMLEKKPALTGNFHLSASIRMNKQCDKCSFPVEVSPGDSLIPVFPCRTEVCLYVKKGGTVYDSGRNAEVLGPSSPARGTGNLQHKVHSNGNKYLMVQKACDNTSMAMYHMIGSKLAELAQAQHLDLSHDAFAYLRRHGSVSGDLEDTCSSPVGNP